MAGRREKRPMLQASARCLRHARYRLRQLQGNINVITFRSTIQKGLMTGQGEILDLQAEKERTVFGALFEQPGGCIEP